MKRAFVVCLVLGACSGRAPSVRVDEDAAVVLDSSVRADVRVPLDGADASATATDVGTSRDTSVVDARDAGISLGARDASLATLTDAALVDSPPAAIDAGRESSVSARDASPPFPDSGPPRAIHPSNLPSDVCASAPSSELVLVPGETRVYNFVSSPPACQVVANPGGPPICLLVYSRVSIAAGATLRFEVRPPVGPPRTYEHSAVAIVSIGPMEILGRIDVGGDGRRIGPGSVNTGVGRETGDSISGAQHRGAGGGSFGSTGAAGGDEGAMPGAASGVVYGNESLIPLLGGSSGGAQNLGFIIGSFSGGGGGGALQLVSCTRISLDEDGFVDANGAGGEGGVGGAAGGGSGGGSGGGILIEAPSVILYGIVTANGGGGGAGGTTAGTPLTPASGGDGERLGGAGGVWSPAGNGGDGAAEGIPAARGMAAANAALGSGGGGGGMGRVRINSLAPPAITGIVSPSATFGTLAVD